ncbi:unnamed protein product [Closterium sp. NIES-54]
MTCLQVSTAPTASSSVVQPLPTQSSPTHSTPFAPPLPLPPTSPAQASSPLPADVCPGLRHANRLCFYLPSPIHFPFPLTFPHFTTLHFPPLSPPFSPGDITPPPPGVHPGPMLEKSPETISALRIVVYEYTVATSEAPSVSNDATMADEEDVPVNTHVIFKHFLTSTEGTSNGPERTLRICRHCKLKFVGGAFRCAQHITRWKGLKRKDVRLCNAPIPSADRGAVRELYEGKHVRREGKKKAEEMAIEACAGGAKKQCIEDFYGEGASCAKESADDAICLMWAALHLPEHLADHPLWRNAVRCIADAGHGYVPPKRRYVGGAGLARCREKIERGLAPITASWKRDGVTISSDMMTDKSGRPQANILLINDSGAMFTESIDCKLETKTGGYIASVLRPIIEKVGPANIVALCMDGGSNYAAACRELMLEYPHIEHVPCATHVMDLLMEDIGEMDWAKDIVAKAGVIITFVRAHHFTKGYMRSPQVKGGKGKQVLKPAGTRFGTQFIAVQRLCEVRSALTQMVLSPQWQAWAKGRKPPVEPFATMIMDAVWWKGAEFFVALLKIPFVVMRKTDSTAKGMMGRMYDLMLQLTEDINAKLEEEEAGLVLSSSERTEVTNIVQKRWDHSMAWRTVTRKEGEELRASHVIQDGLTAFNTLQGSFGLPDAISDRELVKAGKKTAVQWWTWHGTEHPELTTLACRVLSQPVSASACERNWAVWESIHTSKRNRLGSEKCRDLVYVAHNWNIVRNWHKGAEGVTVLPGNIPEASLLEGYNEVLEEDEEGEEDELEDEYK